MSADYGLNSVQKMVQRMVIKSISFQLLLITLALLGFSCKKENPLVPQTGSIVGKITSSDGTPIDSAYIVTLPDSSYTWSDSVGNYTLADVASGVYTVVVSKAGYVSKSSSVEVVKNQSSTLDVSLELLTTTIYGILNFHYADNLYPWTGPLGGATVTINSLTQQTDYSSGLFSIPNVPYNDQKLTIRHQITGLVDTSISITNDTIKLDIAVYPIVGGIYSYLLPYENLRMDAPHNLLKNRYPIFAEIIVDGIINISNGDVSNNCNVRFFTLAKGYHQFYVSYLDYEPLDTILYVDSPYDCVVGNNFASSDTLVLTLNPKPHLFRFDWPLKLGTTWKYSYYRNSKLGYSFEQLLEKGIHTWKLTDSITVSDPTIVAGQKIVYKCQVIKNDTLTRRWGVYYRPDSVYVITDTSYFDIIVCSTSLRMKWEGIYDLFLPGFDTHPGIVKTEPPGVYGTYEEGKGLILANWNSVTMSHGSTGEYKLIELEIP